MQLNQISKNLANKVKKRVGRGGKRGTFSGRGVKGQKSRSGRKMRPEWRDVLKSLPKKRGYKFKSLKNKPLLLDLNDLDRAFKNGEAVTPDSLSKKGLLAKTSGSWPQVKILAQGKLTKKLDFKGVKASGSAREAIQKAGGKFN